MRLGDRRAPSCHMELVLLAHAAGRLFPLAWIYSAGVYPSGTVDITSTWMP
jgi:hypothetical protein